jgi:hypothetical protein
MRAVCIFLFILPYTCNLFAQDTLDASPVETFAIFVSQYTPIDSLYSIQTSLHELGYNLEFDDIEVDSVGLLESMEARFSDVCQKDFETKSPINFKSSFKLGVIFLSADCSQGAFQTAWNRRNTVLGFMFPNRSAPTHYWNVIGDNPDVDMDVFNTNHLIWKTE